MRRKRTAPLEILLVNVMTMELVPEVPLGPDFVGFVTIFRIVVLTWNR